MFGAGTTVSELQTIVVFQKQRKKKRSLSTPTTDCEDTGYQTRTTQTTWTYSIVYGIIITRPKTSCKQLQYKYVASGCRLHLFALPASLQSVVLDCFFCDYRALYQFQSAGRPCAKLLPACGKGNIALNASRDTKVSPCACHVVSCVCICFL